MKFGDMILVTAKLVRATKPREVNGQRSYGFGHYAYWLTREIDPKRVLMIGRRTLFNGDVVFYHDEGHQFTQKESVPAILVVASERTKPFYVPIDHAWEEEMTS